MPATVKELRAHLRAYKHDECPPAYSKLKKAELLRVAESFGYNGMANSLRKSQPGRRRAATKPSNTRADQTKRATTKQASWKQAAADAKYKNNAKKGAKKGPRPGYRKKKKRAWFDD